LSQDFPGVDLSFQSQMSRDEYYTWPAVTRYYNHIQHLQSVAEARTLLRDTPYLLVEFDLANMPPIERKVEVKEKKAKKDSAKTAVAPESVASKSTKAVDTPAQDNGNAAATELASSTDGTKKAKKEKKEKAPAATESKKAKPAPEPTSPLPSMIDLRVGKVLEGKYGTSTSW
jgi:aminoacyl tRNA synthase complex-interacting multifunctional protein 1